jgi:hypothetical protein
MFEPKGEVSVWRHGYQQLLERGIDYGKSYSHEELAALFNQEVAFFLRQRSALYRVIAELESEHGRTLVPVVGKGYRVAHPSEHATVCKLRKKRGRRLSTRAVTLIDSTDQEALQPSERQELVQLKGVLMLSLAVMNVHERRLNRIEEAMRNAGLL